MTPFGSLECCSIAYRTYRWEITLWLNPEQFIILPLSEQFNEYAQGF